MATFVLSQFFCFLAVLSYPVLSGTRHGMVVSQLSRESLVEALFRNLLLKKQQRKHPIMKLVGSSLIFASWALVNGAQGNIINNNRNKNVESSFLNLVAGGSGGMRKQRKGGMMMRVTGNQQKAAKTPKIGGLRTNKKNQPLVPTFMFPESTAQTLVQEQDIIDGTWLLYNIVLEEEVYTVGGSDYKGQVHGVFCKIDLSAQKDDPSKCT